MNDRIKYGYRIPARLAHRINAEFGRTQPKGRIVAAAILHFLEQDGAERDAIMQRLARFVAKR